MGLVRKVVAPATGPKQVIKPQRLQKLTLPEGPTEAVSRVEEVTFLIYGENKIGKTSFAAQFKDPYFLMFEPGGKGLNIARSQCADWEEFVEYINLVLKSDRFKTIIVDPIGLCYKACVDYICNKNGVEDPMEIGYGKGWKAIEGEFTKQIVRISSSGRGVVFLGHPEQVEFERRTGGKYHRVGPRMMKQAKNFIEGFVDVIGFYGFYGNDRMLTIEGSDELDAGNRLKYRFRTVSGEKIHSIPMGDSEEEAYANLLSAFKNKQEDRCIPDYTASVGPKPVTREKARR